MSKYDYCSSLFFYFADSCNQERLDKNFIKSMKSYLNIKLSKLNVDEQLNDQDFDQRSSQVSSSCSNISTESEVVKVVFVKNEKFVEKWGLITEELNVSKGVKKAVLVLVVILLRKLFLALTVVFMRDFPIVVTFLLFMI